MVCGRVGVPSPAARVRLRCNQGIFYSLISIRKLNCQNKSEQINLESTDVSGDLGGSDLIFYKMFFAHSCAVPT